MIKAFLLLFEPVQAWEAIVAAQRRFATIFLTYLLPMILISGAVEGYGLVHWGKVHTAMDFENVHKYTVGEAVVYEVLQAGLSVIVVLVAAQLLKALSETFHGRNTYTQAFTVIAYGLSPLFLLRLLDVFPKMIPWLSWGVGVLLACAILYQGLPRVLLPDPPHAFGLYLMNCLMVILITGLARFATAWYLAGRFKPVDDFISSVAAKLPF